MEYELLTIDGSAILSWIAKNALDTVPELKVSDDTVLHTDMYPRSALLDQIKEQLAAKKDHKQLLKDQWVYVDFASVFPLQDHRRAAFDSIFERGFKLRFPEQDAYVHFVPLLSSASQSKRCIYGFVRKDLFDAGMRNRLDLDFSFESQFAELPPLAYLAKLYGYRALYSSGATPVFRAGDMPSFFHEDNIIVLPELPPIDDKDRLVNVYTSEQGSTNSSNEVTVTALGAQKRSVKLNHFDGVGMITPAYCDLINKQLPQELRGNSLQVRMPFFKGVLHNVNFHRFLRDHIVEHNSEDGEEHAYVIDAFGKERDLFRANIIVTPSMFKLYGLLSEERRRPDIMQTYFEKMRRYNHGLYLIKTEQSFHHTQFVTLNSQVVSTLDLSAEDWDGLIAEHCAAADAYCAQNLLDPEKRKALLTVRNRDEWMTLLLREPAFLQDEAIRKMLENHRKSQYNDIALGRIRVRGENRFLCDDLLYWLIRLCQPLPSANKEKLARLEKRLIPLGAVYMPAADKKIKHAALLRNPHLSRNEDVYANVVDPGFAHFHNKYLGHLKGVIFVSYSSYIPAAMGGADFDGDHIIICYDERVIEACRKSGYSDKGDIPFVQIPALAGGNGCRALGTYVSPQVVYNTFSSRIGRISNAAMKIAAVEYDSTLPVCEGIPSAAFCTILTGTEIDAAKKGLRPDIHNVIGYNGAEHETHKAVVNEVRKFIESKEILKTFSGNAPRLTVDKSGSIIWNKMKLYPNRQHNPVTQLLYRWGDAFIHFHESKEAQLPDGLPPLTSIFPDQNPSPRETGEILRAYGQVIAEYRQKQKKRDEILTLRAENSKKILTRFKGQYDDLDRGDGISVRQRMERLQDALLELAQQYTPEEISALRDRLYSAGDAPFDATVFWPYGSAPSDNALLSDILTLPDADLLTQFRFEGYRLLYYFLDNVALTLTAQSIRPEAEEKDESYRARYLRIAAEYFVKSTSLAAFKKDLGEAARNDLRALLACEAQEDVIRMLYPPKTAEQKKAFWDIFTTGEVLHTLGGDNDAR